MTKDGILARIDAIWHKIRHPTHDLVWKDSPVMNDPEFKCEGDILCNTCNIIFWCRFYDDPNRFNYDKINPDPDEKHKR